MQPVDILYISLAICGFLFVGILGYIAYYLVGAIKSAKVTLDDVANIADDVRGTKDFLKKDVLARLFALGRDFLNHNHANQRKKTTAHSTRH